MDGIQVELCWIQLSQLNWSIDPYVILLSPRILVIESKYNLLAA